MYANLYHHPQQLEIAAKARQIVGGLAEAYAADPALLPDHWRAMLPPDEPARMRHIGDFIAGMTDRFAISRYIEHVGPIAIAEGF
jgi:dGTPase